MTTTHTPGPWRSTTPPSCLLTTRQIRTEHDELIADVGTPGERGVGTIQNVANARLIAAAPSLLAALTDILATAEAIDCGNKNQHGTNCHGFAKQLFTRCHAAIAQATPV